MELLAQRNIGVELYGAGSDDVVLVGTLLDSDHLIKLELGIYLPDEQITRSKLEMIRVPFPVCREVETVADRLVGLRIERGVLQEISRRVGGRVGCSHIKELATNLVYFAASHLVQRQLGAEPGRGGHAYTPPEEWFERSKALLSDSCLAYCQTTALGLDERIGIKKVGADHTHPVPLGEYEPSFGMLLRDRAERWGEKVYLRYLAGGTPTHADPAGGTPTLPGERRSLTWAEFSGRVFQIARHLLDLGIRRGDRVGMLSENRAEMYLFDLAVMSIGGVTVPMFAGSPARQVAYVLDQVRPRFVVVSGRHQLEKIDRGKHPWVERVYCMDPAPETPAGGTPALPFEALTAEGGVSEDRLWERVESVRPEDLCMIMYTSGTTGAPKGVRLCHRHLISQQKAMSLMWDVNENDVVMSYLPWHHSFGGLFERFMTLYNGCELCLDDSRGKDVDRLLENWHAYRPTVFFSVPRVHDLLMARCSEDRSIEEAVLGDRLRMVFTAGASLPAHVASMYREHGIPVLEGWGLTETSPCVTATTRDGSWRSGFVGQPLPGVTVRIDSDQEILVKGPNVMEGYLDDAEATSLVLSSDGWFRTGDLGEFTKEGLRLLGRKDGTFKLTTGEKVHPMRVENALVNESPYISQAVVLGGGRDFVGALLYPELEALRSWASRQGVDSGDLLREPAVLELYAAEMERINPMIEVKFQRVRRAVLADREPSAQAGELTPSGKLVRKVVLEHFGWKIDALFASRPPAEVIEVRDGRG